MLTVRTATTADWPHFPRLARLATSIAGVVHVVEDDQVPVAGAILDLEGRSTEPGVPRIEIELASRRTLADSEAAVSELLATIWSTARGFGAQRVVLPWDTMDQAGQAALARMGFRPAGTWPYFDLGGGAIEHVMGYRDPVGSVVDLVRDAEGAG
ncbi:MAG: hypothetical protein KDA22_16740 [Phycisphaerales bacterium]|nr:hypothetical protein [Phycisphaerales bacterium]